MSRDSLEEDTSYFGSLDTLISSVSGRETHTEVPMSPSILSEEEEQTNLQTREHSRYFTQVFVRTKGYDPSDDEVLEHLNLHN